jgi:[ribosomal protein S18]-alanine N-acetyltransferase
VISAFSYRVEPMEQEDVVEISRVERRCFSNPWPSSAYRRELRNLEQNYYVVLRVFPQSVGLRHQNMEPNGPIGRGLDGLRARLSIPHLPRRVGELFAGPHIAGYAGMWAVQDEAHITTIGVDNPYRGRGFGELLLLALFDEAVKRGVGWITLEVRVSNTVAQRLYEKYGMSVRDRRAQYYSDDGEDAFVMWSRHLREPAYLDLIDRQRQQLRDRMGPEVVVPMNNVSRGAVL